MKKLICSIGFSVFLISSLSAQNSTEQEPLKSKKGLTILPEQGDWALGVNAVPFLNYLGNTMNGSENNGTGFSFLNNDQTIFGKYFLSDDMAVRAALRIGFSSVVTNNFVLANGATSAEDQVEDTRTQNTGNYVISAGIEKRKGKTRIQGYYGAEALIGISTEKTEYEYGNAFSSTNQQVFYTDNFDQGTSTLGSQRFLLDDPASTFTIGARGFIGIEYFIAPKLSLGGEFGWGPTFQVQGEGSAEQEFTSQGEVTELETPIAGSRSFIMDTDNMQGSIKVMFHF